MILFDNLPPPWGIGWRKCRGSIEAHSRPTRSLFDVSRGLQKTIQKNIDCWLPCWFYVGLILHKCWLHFGISFRLFFFPQALLAGFSFRTGEHKAFAVRKIAAKPEKVPILHKNLLEMCPERARSNFSVLC